MLGRRGERGRRRERRGLVPYMTALLLPTGSADCLKRGRRREKKGLVAC